MPGGQNARPASETAFLNICGQSHNALHSAGNLRENSPSEKVIPAHVSLECRQCVNFILICDCWLPAQVETKYRRKEKDSRGTEICHHSPFTVRSGQSLATFPAIPAAVTVSIAGVMSLYRDGASSMSACSQSARTSRRSRR